MGAARAHPAFVERTEWLTAFQVVRRGLKSIQYRPNLINGCLATTGLTLEPE